MLTLDRRQFLATGSIFGAGLALDLSAACAQGTSTLRVAMTAADVQAQNWFQDLTPAVLG